MIRYLIRRPIAVLLAFFTLLITGVVVIDKVPVSLLPNIDVPQIVISINHANTSASVLDENILKPLRESLSNIANLESIESYSTNHKGLLYLTFDYGTQMDLAYIEINEKLDRITNSLPRDVERPQVMRINTSDIPIIRIQVTPKHPSEYIEVSSLVEKVLKKRLEQLDGVSIVDINGKQHGILTVTPDKEALTSLGLDEEVITQAIQSANSDLGSLSVKDGQYSYFVKLTNALENEASISNLPVMLDNGSVISLKTLAKVKYEPDKQMSYHLYNGLEGLVITVQKQPNSRMNDLVPKVTAAVEQFRTDYPTVDFATTQDQSFLLDAGIDNLKQDLLYGGILTIGLLFLFMGNGASITLMSISIPLSLIITFVFFYLFNISFNIISLSGLALGIGMLIDNSIVVIDNITRQRRNGSDMLTSSIEGTNEVITPVITQVLTTVAVYAPLVLLSGMAGSLVWDQCIALTISLAVSLAVAFILTPLLYKAFLTTSVEKLNRDTRFYTWVAEKYHRMITFILQRKLIFFIITICLMPVGFLLGLVIPVDSLPQIEKKESLVKIDWNDPIDAQENLRRTRSLQQHIQPNCTTTEAEVGLKQFLLQQENNTIQKSEIYFACKNEPLKMETDLIIARWLKKFYPSASLEIVDAPNAFTQLFSTRKPYLDVRFISESDLHFRQKEEMLSEIKRKMPDYPFEPGKGLIDEPSYSLDLDYSKMALYGINKADIAHVLQLQFGEYLVSEIKRFGETRSIKLKTDRHTIESKLNSYVKAGNGHSYSLFNFVSFALVSQPKFITADHSGEYISINYQSADDVPFLQTSLDAIAKKYGFNTVYKGSYFDSKAQASQLWVIFIIVLVVLYFILAIQYENLVLPLIVMLTIPIGITGSMFLLWITGGTLDIMAGVGFIVILGLIVDDPILKIETLTRLEKQYVSEGCKPDNKLLERMIHQAGDICLKPLLMVSLTTSIALVPVLFVGGIGNDLQKPLSIVIIGGLTLGTFFTTWFTPLAYWYYMKWKYVKL